MTRDLVLAQLRGHIEVLEGQVKKKKRIEAIIDWQIGRLEAFREAVKLIKTIREA